MTSFVKLLSTQALVICILLLSTIVAAEDSHSHHDHDDHSHDEDDEESPDLASSWIYALLSSLVVSLMSLVSVVFVGRRCASDMAKYAFIGLGAGAMIATSVLTLIPEAIESGLDAHSVGGWLIAGILFGLIVDVSTNYMHTSHDENAKHSMADVEDVNKVAEDRVITKVGANPALAINNIIGDGVHNLLDGILLGVVYLHGIRTGLLVTVSVILHEIPTEVGDYFILLHCGWNRRKALTMNFLSALTAVLGCILGLLIGESSESAVAYFLPLVSGQFLFIALSQLLPDIIRLKWSSSLITAICSLVLGALLIAATQLLPADFTHSH